jgi:hypothetical protein
MNAEADALREAAPAGGVKLTSTFPHEIARRALPPNSRSGYQ